MLSANDINLSYGNPLTQTAVYPSVVQCSYVTFNICETKQYQNKGELNIMCKRLHHYISKVKVRLV
jgi:hypothetical protein